MPNSPPSRDNSSVATVYAAAPGIITIAILESDTISYVTAACNSGFQNNDVYGAMASALVIQNNPDIKIQKWVTIAGVLNHHDWTEYFGDSNLDKSLNIKNLPDVPQIHYVGTDDLIVPIELSKKWVPKNKLRIVPGATHTNFLDFKPDLQ